jgi:histone H3/H4
MMTEEQHEASSDKSADSAEVLVVASKVKSYIKAKSGMNTSATVMEALSARVRRLADEAIARAQADGRKTVMDRDFS